MNGKAENNAHKSGAHWDNLGSGLLREQGPLQTSTEPKLLFHLWTIWSAVQTEIKLYCQMTVSQAHSKLRHIWDTMLQMTKNTKTKFFSLYHEVSIIQRSGSKHS